MGTVLAVIGGLAALFYGGDALYSGWTHHRLKAWEKQVERHADGVRHGCRAFSAGEGERALLLVHGYGTCPAVFREMAPRLAERGFYCQALRLPGFAEPPAEYRRTDAGKWMAEIHRHVTELAARHERVWIVAHSLGGAATLQYKLNAYPEAPVDGIVLLAPAIGISAERSPLLPPRAWFRFLDTFLIFTDVVGNSMPVRAYEADVQDKLIRSKFVPRKVFREMFSLIDQLKDGGRDLKCPVLMVLAKHDSVIDNKAARRFYEELNASRRRIILLEKSRHIIPLDSGLDRTVRGIHEFVEADESIPSD